jgi:phage/conjugal plasmid C-4 type zinc finger TraR family protein
MAKQRTQAYDDLAERLEQERKTTVIDLEQVDRDLDALANDDEQEGGVPANHPADEGSDVYERERLMTVREELRGRLEQIRAAQERMEAGTYGICENCGKPIPRERLEVLPFATMCIDCQAAAEDADPGNKPRLPLT